MDLTARAETRIKQLCCLGLPSESIMPTLLAQMHQLVSGYAYNFFWCDQNYEFTNLYMENLDEIALLLPHYYSEYCNRREAEVVFSFAESARCNLGVETLTSSLKVDKRKYDKHGYYNEILRPVHYIDSMRLLVRERGRAVGAISVHRDLVDGRFTLRDKQQFARLGPFIAHAVSPSGGDRLDVSLVEGEDSGLIIVDRMGKLQFTSPEARRLMFLATHAQIDAKTLAVAGGKIAMPAGVLQLCKNLVAVFENKQSAGQPPVWHHRNPWGGFSFRAYWLNSGAPEPTPLIGITIQHRVPLTIKLIAKLEQFPLSRRQMDIVLLIAANHSHAEIARRMDLSEHTVATHIRRIYEKLDVHDKAALMDKLLGP